MEKLWEALNRAGLVWGAFWFTVWVVVAMLLHGLTTIVMKFDLPQVNAVLVPVRGRIDAFLSAALELVVWVLGFGLGSYAGATGVFGYMWASVLTLGRLALLLMMLGFLVWVVRIYKDAATSGTATILNAQTIVLGHVEAQTKRLAKEKVDEFAFLALQAAVKKFPALDPANAARALPSPAPVPVARPTAQSTMTITEAWRLLRCEPAYATGYGEQDVRRLYESVRASADDAARVDTAWATVCSQRGWRR